MARQSKIILCKNIKMDRDMKHVLSYTESQMLTLVTSSGIKVAEKSDYSFIGRGDRSAINVDVSYSTCLGCNYMAFQNYNYNNKWYFAFIDRVEYINELTTRIYYTVDIFSTWLDYWSNKACYIVREHTNDDTLGANTIDEGLGTGDSYIIRSHQRDITITSSTNFYIASTFSPESREEKFGGKYNGLYSGARFYGYPISGINQAIGYIVNATTGGGLQAIQAVFTAPAFFNPTSSGLVPNSDSPYTYDNEVSPISSIGSYVPKNNKVLTFPFVYYELSNAVGGTAILKQELFNSRNTSGNFVLRVKAVLCPGCSIRMYPVNYNGSTNNVDEGITLGKYPICNFAGDIFTNWVTQNGVNIAVNTAQSLVSLGTGVAKAVATYGAMGSGDIAGGALGVINTLDQIRRADLVPPQVEGNINAGDVMFSSGELTFHVYKKTVKAEIARAVDDYFTMFGYKTNRLKTANQMGRSNWNYVQIAQGETIGYQKDNVTAIPPEDLININKLYQRGITLWHNHATLGDYTQTNSIVS